MVSPDQCVEACELLLWTRLERADAAGVAFSGCRGFEALGIGFPFEIENGRFGPADATDSPRGEDEAQEARMARGLASPRLAGGRPASPEEVAQATF